MTGLIIVRVCFGCYDVIVYFLIVVIIYILFLVGLFRVFVLLGLRVWLFDLLSCWVCCVFDLILCFGVLVVFCLSGRCSGGFMCLFGSLFVFGLDLSCGVYLVFGKVWFAYLIWLR